MDCEFSEAQFAAGLNMELLGRRSPGKGWSAPFLPTQAEEAVLGYDMKLTRGITALILQYKIPVRRDTSRAKFYSWHNQQYYQIKLWPDKRSHQHIIGVEEWGQR